MLLKLAGAFALALLAPAGMHAQQPVTPVTVQGTVFDSLSRTPLANALVQFVREGGEPGFASVTTGSDGKFALKLEPGKWIAGFTHPLVDSLMIELPVRRVDDGSHPGPRVALAIPSSRTLLLAFCGRQTEDSAGVLQGYVRRAPEESRLDSGGVYVQWMEMQIGRKGVERDLPTLRAVVNPDGSYHVCGVPANTEAAVWAQRGAASTGLVTALIPESGIARLDLTLDPLATQEVPFLRDSATVNDSPPLLPGEKLRPAPKVGAARFSGVVGDAKGRPLETARARIIGRRPAKTNGAGVFVLDSLALGTQTLEVRALGYVPVSRLVNVTATAPPDTIRMTSIKALLDTIRVTGTRVYNADMNGFEMRRRGGMGRYISREDIDRRRPYDFTSLLYSVPGTRVSFRAGQVSVAMRGTFGNCTPAIYIDGFQQMLDYESDLNFLVQPDEIEGVEIYNSGASTPAQFSGRGELGCGSIVVWTRLRPRAFKVPEKP